MSNETEEKREATMAKIEIERSRAIQEGRPDSVHIKLIGTDGETKTTIDVYPRFEKPPFTDTFRVEIHKGGYLSPDVDISLNL